MSDENSQFQFDIENILNILPHRYPFLMVDRIISIDTEKNVIVGQKNISINENFFQGHFPHFHVMPGVLIIEAIAQVGAVLLHKKGVSKKLALLLSVNHAKFRHSVHPGDVLFLHCKGLHINSRGGKCKGQATVNGKLVAEAEVCFALTDKTVRNIEPTTSTTMEFIHPTAIIEPGATLGNNVKVEPYAIIKNNVVIEDNVTIKAHCYIDGHTTIGEGTVIWPFASIGTKTQDLKYKGEKTFVKIGKFCDIREHTQINSSAGEGSSVIVGDHCLIMASCHVAHQCTLGNHVILSGGAMLAGHVTIEDHAIIGGVSGIHQFCRVGRHAMVGGMSRITHDIPPYTVGGGVPYKFGGVNNVGLKRHGFSYETRKALHSAFKLVYRSELSLEQALRIVEEKLGSSEEIQYWLHFCRHSQRGLMGLQSISQEFRQEQNTKKEFDCESEEDVYLIDNP